MFKQVWLNPIGKMPCDKLLFIIDKLLRQIVSTASLKSHDRRMSQEEIVSFRCNITSFKCARDISKYFKQCELVITTRSTLSIKFI